MTMPHPAHSMVRQGVGMFERAPRMHRTSRAFELINQQENGSMRVASLKRDVAGTHVLVNGPKRYKELRFT
jgi:hypothetical protein